MQSYPDIVATDDLDLSLDPLKARDDASRSQFAGTSFPSSPVDGQPCWRTDQDKLYVYDLSDTTWRQVYPPLLSVVSGVVGPASATDNHFVQFDSTTGKLIKDGGLSFSTDSSLAANSDSIIVSQKAIVSYVGTIVSNLIAGAPSVLDTFNEFAAAIGNDANFASTMTTALATKMAKSANLSDLANAGTARTNLGVAIGSDVQAYSAVLTTYAGIAPTSIAQNILAAANAAAVKSLLSFSSGDITGYLGYTPANKAGDTYTGTHDFSEGLKVSGVISPAQLTANTDDWAPTGFSAASVIRVSTDASRNLTGIAGGAAGSVKILFNIGTQNLVLKNDVTSTAANRFKLNGDLTLPGGASALIWYDTTSSRWRAMYQPPAGGTGLTSGDIGATVQAWAAKLDALAAMTWAADKGFYTTSSSAIATFDLSSFARTVLDDTSAAAAATTLGLGTGNTPQFTGIEVGNASDTTVTRSAAGVLAVEGNIIPHVARANTFTQSQTVQISSGVALTVQGTGGIPTLKIASQNGGGNFGGQLNFTDTGSGGGQVNLTSIANGNEFRIGLTNGNTYSFWENGNGFYFSFDNSQSLGGASNRWGNVYASNGTIVTSDQREKTKREALTKKLMDFASELFGGYAGTFQFLKAVAEKGPDKARIHIGMIAQEVVALAAKHEIDAFRYGFVGEDLLYDDQVVEAWTGELAEEVVTELVEQSEVERVLEDGKLIHKTVVRTVEQPVTFLAPVQDENGAPVPMEIPFGPIVPTPPVPMPVTRYVPVLAKTVTRVPRLDDKGEHKTLLNLRYDQLHTLALASAFNAQKALEARVKALEAKVGLQ